MRWTSCLFQQSACVLVSVTFETSTSGTAIVQVSASYITATLTALQPAVLSLSCQRRRPVPLLRAQT